MCSSFYLLENWYCKNWKHIISGTGTLRVNKALVGQAIDHKQCLPPQTFVSTERSGATAYYVSILDSCRSAKVLIVMIVVVYCNYHYCHFFSYSSLIRMRRRWSLRRPRRRRSDPSQPGAVGLSSEEQWTSPTHHKTWTSSRLWMENIKRKYLTVGTFPEFRCYIFSPLMQLKTCNCTHVKV